VTFGEAMRLALAPGELAGIPVTEVVTDGWVEELMDELTDRQRLSPVPVPCEFTGELRPYQKVGLSWLAFLHRYGLGACLADDMGLGKTIQTIALLLHKQNGAHRKPALLICPMSVVSNWEHEVARFAPSLRVMVHHGGRRAKEDFATQAHQHDLVITSFALLQRDEKQLAVVQWGDLIVDEAQNIKNPDTKQARSARKLPAEHRLALTGTPVENRLSELWSILEFLNPGYLGTKSDFQERFARPIERAQDHDAADRLKSLVGPFILRRLKTDPSVIADLPAKNEMKVFCPLTKEQATLYEAVVRDSLRQIEGAEGIARRGVVLATLMKLKQVCNHPAELLKDGSTVDDRSGKLARLTEMMEEARLSGEHALIFTQFADMGRMLKTHLEKSLSDDVLFLHGGTPRKARDEMIDRFQHDPYAPSAFVLSLKAGGTGLNLTRASQVFHFDRWWNPAVEDQATDRAFRIGQTRKVQVYKFLCTGTMEERIDEMIERKKALSEAIVGTSEAWITELSTEDLREIFQLRKEAVSE
ncbi:MAG TPA: DEAD/DEAH box helicase, partial [Nitrolancea sp.]|nr:DEAD/DEAH box helicase [Nitrolancea sp.]